MPLPTIVVAATAVAALLATSLVARQTQQREQERRKGGEKVEGRIPPVSDGGRGRCEEEWNRVEHAFVRDPAGGRGCCGSCSRGEAGCARLPRQVPRSCQQGRRCSTRRWRTISGKLSAHADAARSRSDEDSETMRSEERPDTAFRSPFSAAGRE